jgi:hypothetical protein
MNMTPLKPRHTAAFRQRQEQETIRGTAERRQGAPRDARKISGLGCHPRDTGTPAGAVHPRVPSAPEVSFFIFKTRSGNRRLLGVQIGPCLPDAHGQRRGGFAPHRFPWVLWRQGAVWTLNIRRFPARLLNIIDFEILGCARSGDTPVSRTFEWSFAI